MKLTNRMLRTALASALACAAFAGVAAASEDPATGASQDTLKAQPSGLPSSSMSGQKDAQSIIESWPAKTKKAAQALIEKYGQPNGMTDKMLVWDDKEPWAQVTVYRDAFADEVPIPHQDFVENTVEYKVPENKIADLIKFDRALVIDETRGTLSSHCDSEEANTLALNLADEIVSGKRDVASAKEFLKTTLSESMAGKSSSYMKKLMFPTSPRQATTPETAPINIPRPGY